MAKQQGGAEAAQLNLTAMVDNVVSVLTNDGRIIVGMLRGYDQATNLILADARERVFSTKAGVETVSLGLYMVRGDNVAVMGLIDEEVDLAVDLSAVRAAPLKPIKH